MTVNAELLASLPYAEVVVPDVDTEGRRVFVASNPELRGCMAHGDTVDEARHNLAESRLLYIESALEDGVTLPVPEATKKSVRGFVAVWVDESQPAQVYAAQQLEWAAPSLETVSSFATC